MIEMQAAADAEAAPARTEDELEERISLRIGATVRIVDSGDSRYTGILEFIGLSRKHDGRLSVKLRGMDVFTCYYPLDRSFEYLLDGRWQPIHIPPKRQNGR